MDSVVGAKPGPGVYVLVTHDDARQRRSPNLYKLGAGPLYSSYAPYHLCHVEVPLSVAHAVVFGDAVLQPLDRAMVDVVATAKTDLRAGEVLDGIGGNLTYGRADNSDVAAAGRLLRIGVAEGCKILRAVERDTLLAYDVELPAGRIVEVVRAEHHAV